MTDTITEREKFFLFFAFVFVFVRQIMASGTSRIRQFLLLFNKRRERERGRERNVNTVGNYLNNIKTHTFTSFAFKSYCSARLFCAKKLPTTNFQQQQQGTVETVPLFYFLCQHSLSLSFVLPILSLTHSSKHKRQLMSHCFLIVFFLFHSYSWN